jgi:hypothetical protein
VVIDAAFESITSPEYPFIFYSNIIRVNNTLVVNAYKGYSPDYYNSHYWCFFIPSEVTNYFYVSKDNGTTWQLADNINSDPLNSIVASLYSSGDKMFAAVGWLAGGLYRIPLSAFGISPPVELFTQKTHGERNTDILVPVKTNYFRNILSAQFSVNWNPAVATFVDTESFSLNEMDVTSFGTSNASAGQLTFSWSDPKLAVQTLADSSVLFNIKLRLTGNYGAKTAVTISGQPLAIEVINSAFSSSDVNVWTGTITIDSLITIKGKTLYSNNQAVQSVTVNLTGGLPQNFLTDQQGNYSFTAPAGIKYSIVPSKVNDPNPLNGIDAQDVATVRRHILGVQSLSNSYQIISADVNESNTVSTLDIDYIQALILGVNNNFPNNDQWKFTPANFIFPDSSNPFPYPQSVNLTQVDGTVNQDFIGMKLGDVNSSRDNSQQNRMNVTNEVIFVIEGKNLGDSLEVPILVRNFDAISAYQFTVNWDKEKLEYLDSSDENTDGLFGENHVDEGVLTTLWDQRNGRSTDLSYESALFNIQFRKKTDDASSNDVNITSSKTAIAVYDKNLNPVSFSIDRKQEDLPTGFELYQNFPNGFDTKTQIGFSIPYPGPVRLDIIDVTGRLLMSFQGDYDTGTHYIEWNGKDLSGAKTASGLYIYRATYRSKSTARRMMKY